MSKLRNSCPKGLFQADCSFGFSFFEAVHTLSKSFPYICSKNVYKLSKLQPLRSEDNSEDFEFFKFEGIFSCFFFENVSSFERYSSRNCILRIRLNNSNTFIGKSRFLKFFRNQPQQSQTFGPETQQVFRTATYVFR